MQSCTGSSGVIPSDISSSSETSGKLHSSDTSDISASSMLPRKRSSTEGFCSFAGLSSADSASAAIYGRQSDALNCSNAVLKERFLGSEMHTANLHSTGLRVQTMYSELSRKHFATLPICVGTYRKWAPWHLP